MIYRDPVDVHPDRIGANRSTQEPMVKWLILHTSEQSGVEDPTDAEALAGYLRSPGDRQGSRGMWGSSYHGITDTDHVKPAVADHLVAYAAGGANRYGLHLCLPVRVRPRSDGDPDANTSRERWLDDGSRWYIVRAAEWIVEKARTHDIPLRRIEPDQMRAGESGYCDHWTASQAFGKSTHTDVGPTFPWDVLAAEIDRLTTPTTPEERPVRYMLKPPTERGGGPWFLRYDGTWSYLTGRDREHLNAEGVPTYDDLPERYDLVHLEVFGSLPRV